MGSQQGLYTSGATSQTSFLLFNESPARQYSPSLSKFTVESGPYGSEGHVTPNPRALTGVAGASHSRCTTPLLPNSVALPPGNQDDAWNLLHPLALTLSTSETVTVGIFGNFYLYTEVYHESWIEWWQGLPGYIAYTRKYGGKKKIRWNSDLRGRKVSKYFPQCADGLGSALSTLRVMCIMCRKVLAHLSGTGSSSMQDHNRSAACLKSRKINGYDGRAGSPLPIDGHRLVQKGTKTGNTSKILDLATPAGCNQHDCEESFLKVFLATNLAINCLKNLSFRHIFKFFRPGVEIPTPMTFTLHFKWLGKSTVHAIRTSLPAAGNISRAADIWTSLNKLALLEILAYWISDSWQIEEVLIGFEEIRGSHMGTNMAGIINDVVARYGIQDTILGFTTDSASNNRIVPEALNDPLSLPSVELCQLENHIQCMAHVVQLILSGFMSTIKVKSRDGHRPFGFMAGYMEKVMRLGNVFHKTVEKVMCLRSHTPAPISKIDKRKFIRTRAYAKIHCSKLHARQCESRI